MNNELFERLLYESESVTIDFKKQQYRFAKATDDEKSELLKDILGFANSWRRSSSYILIGVEENRGGRANVIGIQATEHLDDHSLQQFASNLTNKVRFSYEAFEFEGKQVGVITIDEQTRPLYLMRDFGKLKKNEVYVRRGSSTDPTKPALPDEIAQMRSGIQSVTANLVVEFCDVERGNPLGVLISWDAELCNMPATKEIPLLPSPPDPLYNLSGFENRVNNNYFRELARFQYIHGLYRAARLVVINVGEVVANSVRVELAVKKGNGELLYASEMPESPKRRFSALDSMSFRTVRSIANANPGDVKIRSQHDKFSVEIDCGSLQPGRRILSKVFYMAKQETGELSLYGYVFADNLPRPQEITLTVQAQVHVRSVTVQDLIKKQI